MLQPVNYLVFKKKGFRKGKIFPFLLLKATHRPKLEKQMLFLGFPLYAERPTAKPPSGAAHVQLANLLLLFCKLKEKGASPLLPLNLLDLPLIMV